MRKGVGERLLKLHSDLVDNLRVHLSQIGDADPDSEFVVQLHRSKLHGDVERIQVKSRLFR